MQDRVREAAVALAGDRPVIVAISGGADSAVAAWALRAVTTRAVHVHHGYPASDRLAEAARSVADVLGYSLTVLRVHPEGTSETAAREARWQAILDAVDGGVAIATGHTRDDQAETVLHNLLRGSGPEGLSGMRQTERIIRPLLDEARDDVRALADELGLPYYDDPENRSRDHRRNRIRDELIPMLEETYNPALRESLARTASHLGQHTVRPAPFATRGDLARIPVAILKAAEPVRAVATVREAIRVIRPPHPPSSAEVDRVMAVATGDAPRAELEGGITVLVDRTSVRLGPIPQPLGETPLIRPVTVAGGFRLGVTDATRRPLLSPERTHLRVDADWVVRGARKEDVIALGSGHKSVWESLGEARVPAALRPAWPVVADGETVAWVPLVRRAVGARPPEVGYLEVNTFEELW